MKRREAQDWFGHDHPFLVHCGVTTLSQISPKYHHFRLASLGLPGACCAASDSIGRVFSRNEHFVQSLRLARESSTRRRMTMLWWIVDGFWRRLETASVNDRLAHRGARRVCVPGSERHLPGRRTVWRIDELKPRKNGDCRRQSAGPHGWLALMHDDVIIETPLRPLPWQEKPRSGKSRQRLGMMASGSLINPQYRVFERTASFVDTHACRQAKRRSCKLPSCATPARTRVAANGGWRPCICRVFR
jgi:hypothetical protein